VLEDEEFDQQFDLHGGESSEDERPPDYHDLVGGDLDELEPM
jgi:hypothetical protein